MGVSQKKIKPFNFERDREVFITFDSGVIYPYINQIFAKGRVKSYGEN